ncbi:MAG: GntP family permease [Eubacteriales bacterium]|jgi:GntP family gluconate:H+ symporter
MVNGLSGERMLIALFIGIALLIFMVMFTKIQAFLAMIICTVVIGVIGGMPLLNTTIELEDGTTETFGIINSITSGFGGTLGSIGIIIGFGVMMGQIFEVTGAAKRMAYTFLRVFGKGREEEALAFTGFLVSIPIFCDSGFIILSPIAKALSKATKKSVIGLGAALAAGLVITHSLVPPTPGPLGVCGIFGVDVGIYILVSLVLAIPMAIACILYAKKVLAKKYFWIWGDDDLPHPTAYTQPDYDAAFNMDMSDTPGAFESFAPLLLPIVLILLNTVLSAVGLESGIFEFIIFLGQPIIAVGLGLILAIFTLGRRLDRNTCLKEMEKGMASAGIIMLVTGAGGSLGQIIKDSGLGNYMANGLASAAVPMIILPLLISTAMRFIQGSGTVAMTTAASISAPILNAAGVNPVLGCVACCVGSLFCSYFNDSYFWVVNRTLGVEEAKDQMRIWTVTTGIAWAVGVVEVVILSLIFH